MVPLKLLASAREQAGMLLVVFGVALHFAAGHSVAANVVVAALGAGAFYLFGCNNQLLALMPSMRAIDEHHRLPLNNYILAHLSVRIFLAPLFMESVVGLVDASKHGSGEIMAGLISIAIGSALVYSHYLLDGILIKDRADKFAPIPSLIAKEGARDYRNLDRTLIALSVFALDGLIFLLSFVQFVVGKADALSKIFDRNSKALVKTSLNDRYIPVSALQGFAGTACTTLAVAYISGPNSSNTLVVQALLLLAAGYLAIYVGYYFALGESARTFLRRTTPLFDAVAFILPGILTALMLARLVPNPAFKNLTEIFNSLRVSPPNHAWEQSLRELVHRFEGALYVWLAMLPACVSLIAMNNLVRLAERNGFKRFATALDIITPNSFGVLATTLFCMSWNDVVIQTCHLISDVETSGVFISLTRRVAFLVIPWVLILGECILVIGVMLLIKAEATNPLPSELYQRSERTFRQVVEIAMLLLYVLPLGVIGKTALGVTGITG